MIYWLSGVDCSNDSRSADGSRRKGRRRRQKVEGGWRPHRNAAGRLGNPSAWWCEPPEGAHDDLKHTDIMQLELFECPCLCRALGSLSLLVNKSKRYFSFEGTLWPFFFSLSIKLQLLWYLLVLSQFLVYLTMGKRAWYWNSWRHVAECQSSSTNSRTWRDFCWKNLICFFISPKQKSKQTQLCCWRGCGEIVVDHAHVFCSCPSIQTFWKEVATTISKNPVF